MLEIIIALCATAYLFIAIFIFGARKPGYSQLRHTISELGEINAPDQRLVAFGVFFPVGLALLLVAYLVQPLGVEIAALALCISTGYLVATAFPCDAGSPLSGTNRQAIHNIGGAIEYIGGGFALLRISEQLGQPFQVASFIVFAVAFGISLEPLALVRGLIQRIAELCLLGGLVFAIWLNTIAG